MTQTKGITGKDEIAMLKVGTTGEGTATPNGTMDAKVIGATWTSRAKVIEEEYTHSTVTIRWNKYGNCQV